MPTVRPVRPLPKRMRGRSPLRIAILSGITQRSPAIMYESVSSATARRWCRRVAEEDAVFAQRVEIERVAADAHLTDTLRFGSRRGRVRSPAPSR